MGGRDFKSALPCAVRDNKDVKVRFSIYKEWDRRYESIEWRNREKEELTKVGGKGKRT